MICKIKGVSNQTNYCGVDMTKSILTQDRLKNLLNYNPDTGLFTWAVDRSPKIKKDSLAGAIADGYIRIGVDNRGQMVSSKATKTGEMK